ncbi:TolC family protein [Flavobacterium sp. LS1R49]|uniref:TolC family protein n=1 Tax=Flavobacterium shii TaxID=2987687 RepID=A0A9X2ZGY6_9FLAO|nr:TolC family protein [Flavobacterium shii]MCV9927518.1 TolC family protein [Flavobacterium shii]
MVKKYFILFFIFISFFNHFQIYGQVGDTLKLDIKETEKRFIDNNLQLIAGRYNIDIAGAEVITSKLFPNPDFNYTNGIAAKTDPGSNLNAYAERTFGISQLIQTAGKRNKNIKLANLGVEQSKHQFFDLLRTLKFSLRSDFYNLYYQQQSARVYNKEISSLARLLDTFRIQSKKGNIAEKEVIRIQSQLYSLQGEYNDLFTNIDSLQKELKIFLRLPGQTYVVPQVSTIAPRIKTSQVPYVQLLDSALVNRQDLMLSKSMIEYSKVNLKLQKALAVPDVSLSVNYDRLGGFGTDFFGAGIDINLPFFSRNQGEIKKADLSLKQNQVLLDDLLNRIENDVASGYQASLRIEKIADGIDPEFNTNFNRMINAVFENYQKRNISLLEFLDFYDSYKNNTLQINNIMLNRVLSFEQLNYLTGTSFFN